jgi:hypothetical protein
MCYTRTVQWRMGNGDSNAHPPLLTAAFRTRPRELATKKVVGFEAGAGAEAEYVYTYTTWWHGLVGFIRCLDIQGSLGVWLLGIDKWTSITLAQSIVRPCLVLGLSYFLMYLLYRICSRRLSCTVYIHGTGRCGPEERYGHGDRDRNGMSRGLVYPLDSPLLLQMLGNGFNLHNLSLAHLPEEVHDTREDNEQHSASGSQSQHLGQEALVQRTEALLFHDRAERGPCPIVLGDCSCDLGRVLDARLDHVHGRVENGSYGATDSTRKHVTPHLARLGLRLGQQLPHLEDASEVSRVPENVAPHCAFESLVEGEGSLVFHNLGKAVNQPVVSV